MSLFKEIFTGFIEIISSIFLLFRHVLENQSLKIPKRF